MEGGSGSRARLTRHAKARSNKWGQAGGVAVVGGSEGRARDDNGETGITAEIISVMV